MRFDRWTGLILGTIGVALFGGIQIWWQTESTPTWAKVPLLLSVGVFLGAGRSCTRGPQKTAATEPTRAMTPSDSSIVTEAGTQSRGSAATDLSSGKVGLQPEKLPIQMSWLEAEAFLRGSGYPSVRPAGAPEDRLRSTSLRGDDEGCASAKDCRGRKPSVVFDFSRPRDDQPPQCISFLSMPGFDWRRAISLYTGADPSSLPEPDIQQPYFEMATDEGYEKAHKARPKEATLATPIGEMTVHIDPDAAIVSMGKNCER
jgi:hypothetical protein